MNTSEMQNNSGAWSFLFFFFPLLILGCTLVLAPLQDTIEAGRGKDTIFGGDGGDLLHGGPGKGISS